jgi:hypothetical protein
MPKTRRPRIAQAGRIPLLISRCFFKHRATYGLNMALGRMGTWNAKTAGLDPIVANTGFGRM